MLTELLKLPSMRNLRLLEDLGKQGRTLGGSSHVCALSFGADSDQMNAYHKLLLQLVNYSAEHRLASTSLGIVLLHRGT
jgi:hypothetical protein